MYFLICFQNLLSKPALEAPPAILASRLADETPAACFQRFRRISIKITTGAPRTEVTVLILSSVGAKAMRAMRSLNMQKTAPPRKAAGITTRGFDVPRARLTKKGTAIPTKEMGPAKAVTQADRIPERRIKRHRQRQCPPAGLPLPSRSSPHRKNCPATIRAD